MSTEISSMQEITVPLMNANLQSESQPAFAEIGYAELVANLSFYYKQLCDFTTTPAIILYDDLASLRRRAVVSAEITSPGFNRYQLQLRLAADLMRLGRRKEGFNVLKGLEERLMESRNPARNKCYVLWSALLRAVAGDKQGAFALASQVSAQATDLTLDTKVVSFFSQLDHSLLGAIQD